MLLLLVLLVFVDTHVSVGLIVTLEILLYFISFVVTILLLVQMVLGLLLVLWSAFLLLLLATLEGSSLLTITHVFSVSESVASSLLHVLIHALRALRSVS